MKLPIDGAEHAIISDQVLNLPSRPKKMAVIGGGYIGLEFAGIYNHFGAETHVFYRQVRFGLQLCSRWMLASKSPQVRIDLL